MGRPKLSVDPLDALKNRVFPRISPKDLPLPGEGADYERCWHLDIRDRLTMTHQGKTIKVHNFLFDLYRQDVIAVLNPRIPYKLYRTRECSSRSPSCVNPYHRGPSYTDPTSYASRVASARSAHLPPSNLSNLTLKQFLHGTKECLISEPCNTLRFRLILTQTRPPQKFRTTCNTPNCINPSHLIYHKDYVPISQPPSSSSDLTIEDAVSMIYRLPHNPPDMLRTLLTDEIYEIPLEHIVQALKDPDFSHHLEYLRNLK